MPITIMSGMMSRPQSLVIAGTQNSGYINLICTTVSNNSSPEWYLGMSLYCDGEIILISEKNVIVCLEDTDSFRKVFMNPTKCGMNFSGQIFVGVFDLQR
jgi:hypothetical protein